MRKLIRVSRDVDASAAYLYYSDKEPAKQISLDEESMLNVDYAADGTIVGIELLSPRNEEMAKLVAFAQENELSLEGAFIA